MVATPFLTFYIAGLIFSADTLYIIKFFLLGCLYGAAHSIGKSMFDDHLMSLLPLSVYMATKLWFYVTWLGYIAPTVSTFTTLLFLLSSCTLWYCFLKAWRGDPGVIKPTQEQRFRVRVFHPKENTFHYKISDYKKLKIVFITFINKNEFNVKFYYYVDNNRTFRKGWQWI